MVAIEERVLCGAVSEFMLGRLTSRGRSGLTVVLNMGQREGLLSVLGQGRNTAQTR